MKQIEFIGSFPSADKCQVDDKPEYAFIGRSNVGKSSFINALTNRNALARVSKQPGKTQSINFFLIDADWYLVDLPGYGYAKVSKKMRGSWDNMVRTYLRTRTTISCIFQLVDISVPVQQIDLDFINWLGSCGLPFVLILTKADKAKEHVVNQHVEAFQQSLLESWEDLPPMVLTSALTKMGREEVLQIITDANRVFNDYH